MQPDVNQSCSHFLKYDRVVSRNVFFSNNTLKDVELSVSDCEVLCHRFALLRLRLSTVSDFGLPSFWDELPSGRILPVDVRQT